MTGEEANMKDVKPSKGKVTSDDGINGQIHVVGTLNVLGLLLLKQVLLVQGLKANLISISQLCYQHFIMSLTKDYCIVQNK